MENHEQHKNNEMDHSKMDHSKMNHKTEEIMKQGHSNS